ncbi:MAG: polyprenyl synthetase family protein [Nitrospirota bacterium]|nr:polyprenyl synthetase family protein [Nitrospirota bacterium]
MTIQEVFNLHKGDLQRMEFQLKDNLRSSVPLTFEMGDYLISGGGKRLRPLLLMLSARLSGYSGGNETLLCTIVEFIHMASLLHDDVIDAATVRRGKTSANAIWGNKASILVGDYLSSKALHMAVQLKDPRITATLAEIITLMSEGELLQLLSTGDVDVTEERYLNIIRHKTAILISGACRLGGLLGNASDAQVQALADYGMQIGLAFQIADDALDYCAVEQNLGKSLGKDLSEGKITLPLIHLLSSCNETENSQVREIIYADSPSESELRYILDLMNRYRSIEYALGRAKEIAESGTRALSVFNSSPELESFYAVAGYVVEREL